MTKATWLMVANSSEARLFERSAPTGELHQLMQWSHPSSREHLALAHHQHRHSGTRERSGLASRKTVKHHERQLFACEIAAGLKKETGVGLPARLVVFAAPAFLGRLKSAFATALPQQDVTYRPQNLSGLSRQALDLHWRIPGNF